MLSTLDGIPAAGNWTLEITDDAGGDSGTLLSWSLVLTTSAGWSCSPCALAPPGGVTQLSFTGKEAVTWSAAPGATNYYLYRGAAGDLPKLLDASIDSCERGSTPCLSMAA